MPVDLEVIRSRLASLIQYLQELETLRDLSYEEYSSEFKNKRTVERLLQLVVETASDINAHIIVKKNSKPPADHHFSFIRLGQLGILPEPLCRRLARSVGLRNRLVHEYESVDDRIVFNSIRTALQQYRSYVSSIQRFLDHSPED